MNILVESWTRLVENGFPSGAPAPADLRKFAQRKPQLAVDAERIALQVERNALSAKWLGGLTASAPLPPAAAIAIGRTFAKTQPGIPELWPLDRTTKVLDKGSSVIVSLPIWDKAICRKDVYAEMVIDKATRKVLFVQAVDAHTGERGKRFF